MVVKENQPTLHEAIVTAFADPAFLAAHPGSRVTSWERGHGRQEQRTLTASSALVGFLGWPGHQQIFRLVRRRTLLKTGEVRTQTVYGVTSLSPRRVLALLGLTTPRTK